MKDLALQNSQDLELMQARLLDMQFDSATIRNDKERAKASLKALEDLQVKVNKLLSASLHVSAGLRLLVEDHGKLNRYVGALEEQCDSESLKAAQKAAGV
jgi:hypothetical protein